MTREMERTELIAREGIRDLLGRYTWAGDRGRSADLAACFTTTGTLDVGDHGGAWVGRDQIARELDAVAARIARAGEVLGPVNHHISSVFITMNDPTSAEVRSYFCVYTVEGADHWGSYRDHVVLDPTVANWLFATRVVRVTGSAPGSRFLPGGPNS